MTKIRNKEAYPNKASIVETDYIPGTDSETQEKDTVTFSFGDIRSFALAGLTPETGGTLKITEIVYTGAFTTPSQVLNSLDPNYTVLRYHLLVVKVNGAQWIFKLQNVVVGLGQAAVSDSDFIKIDIIVPPFEKVDEGSGEGITIRDRNSDNFGALGFSALDLSKSLSASSSYGARAFFSAILNGQNQTITPTSEGSIIGSGFNNYINAKFSGILDGTNNNIDGIGGGTGYVICGGLGNSINDNSFVGVSGIFSGNNCSVNTYYAFIVGGDGNTISETGTMAIIGNGENNTASGYQSFIGNGTDSIASGANSTVINSNSSEAKGNASIVLNGTNIADSFAEIAGGYFGTTYTPVSRISFNVLDRILNIGIGLDDNNRKDGLSLFKNGIVLLPEATISLIDAANARAAVTKEYLLSKIASIPPPDGSETKIIDGTKISKTGNGTIATPYILDEKPLQKTITYPADFIGTTYTLTNADDGYDIYISNGATAVSLVIPSGLKASFYCGGYQKGTGDVSFSSSGTTLNSPLSMLKIKGQNYNFFVQKYLSTENYQVSGTLKS